MSEMTTAKRKELFGHPVGLYILFFTELWERFSYYGMRAILVYYMIASGTAENAGLGFGEGNALALYGWYTMLVYVMSIPGGILADKFIGQKKSVMIGGLILVAGHGILAIDALWAFYTGLLLIVLGVGGLKPNISTLVGGLYPPGDERRDQGFTIFYIGINIGAFLAALVVGAIGEKIGWHYGFGLAGIGMLVGQLVFMFGQRHLKGIGDAPRKKGKGGTLEPTGDETTSLGTLFKNLFSSPLHLIITTILVGASIFLGYSLFEGYEQYAYSALFVFLSIIAGLMMMVYKDITAIEKDRFVVLLLSFLIVIVFWGAFEQAGGLMNIYTLKKIDRVVSLPILDIVFIGVGALLLLVGVYRAFAKKKQIGYLLGAIGIVVLVAYFILRSAELTNPYEIPGSVFQSVNPLFIIIFGTIVASFWLWWQHRGMEESSLFKMAIGTLVMGVGFIFMGIASQQAAGGPGEKGMLILLILAYLFHTLGELSASPVALSFVTKVAPVKYVSLMMGLYFAATGLGNKVAGAIGESSQAEPIVVEIAEGHEADFNPFVADTVLQKRMNFELVTDLNVVDGKVRLTKGDTLVNEMIVLDEKDQAELVDRIGEDVQETYTGVLTFEPESEEAGAPYQAQVEIYELQNKREFRTFMMIFLFTAAFAILLLVFLKKLKKLTHGSDSGRKVDHEEAGPEPQV